MIVGNILPWPERVPHVGQHCVGWDQCKERGDEDHGWYEYLEWAQDQAHNLQKHRHVGSLEGDAQMVEYGNRQSNEGYGSQADSANQ